MPSAGPQQMSDPGEKSDDLISELAKLMASGASGNGSAALKPISRPAPLDAAAPPPPSPIRIPGLDTPAPVVASPMPQAPRPPATGTIRIPGMDQPAPVTTSAPVAKFDFGKPPATPILRTEPPAPVIVPKPMAGPTAAPIPAPVRIPSQLQPVSENRSFGEAPAPVLTRAVESPPAAASEPADSGFKFDFGFGQSGEKPTPTNDPIADLIAAEMDADEAGIPEPVALPPRESRPVEARPIETQMTPVMRTQVTPQPAPAKPTLSPLAAAVAARPANSAPIPLKPLTANPRPAESDRFAISPGMGLNGRPTATQPLSMQPAPPRGPEPDFNSDDSDPMAEIESLIGEAVRVELGPGPVKVQTPVDVRAEMHMEPLQAPVVPPLNTQFAPRRAGIVDHDDGAEEAILAASADTGASIGRLDNSIADESPYRRLKVKPQRTSFVSGGMRQYVGMAVAGTLLLAAGLGLYWVLNMGRGGDPAAAPVLTADATPVKVAPEPMPTPSEELATSPVMAQLDGTSTAPSTEQLVSTDETGGQDVARVVGATPEAVTPIDDPTADGGLANRKVRTVTVRPDGTIVPGDDAVAGAEELPVDRPNVPDVPGAIETAAAGANVDLLGDQPAATPDPIASAIETANAEPDALVAVASLDPAANGGVLDLTKVPPVIAHAPDYDAMALASTAAPEPLAAIDDSASAEAEPITPVTPVSAGAANAYVQLTSSPSEADANAQLRAQTARFGSLFGGNELMVQPANLGQKGTWYRVRLPAASLSEAQRICADIKANGGDCYATNS